VRVETPSSAAHSAWLLPWASILASRDNARGSSLAGRPPCLPQRLISALLWRSARARPPIRAISVRVIGFSLMRRSVHPCANWCPPRTSISGRPTAALLPSVPKSYIAILAA